MNRTKLIALLSFVIVIVVFLVGLQTMQDKPAADPVFSQTNVRYGAAGGDVYELQGRLEHLGFYHGNIDGDFGYQTLKAVKNFQSQFGMKVDGVAGAKTKLKLWEATKAWKPDTAHSTSQKPSNAVTNLTPSSHLGMSAEDLQLAANAVYGEARGESYTGQVAVAAVIFNRVKSASFPNTISGVIFQPGAFTAVADGQIWLQPNETAKKAVKDALNGMDPSSGAIYYFNPETATSKWIWSRPQIKKIGKHIFCN